MKVFPSFPKVGKIPFYAPTQEAILCTSITATLLVILYSIYGHWVITTFSSGVILLKFWLLKKRIILNKYVLFALLIIALSLLVVLFGGYTGRQASLALLTLLFSLKLLESNESRGYSITCLLMYFLSAIIFAYEDSTLAILILLLSCLLITCCLALLSQTRPSNQLLTLAQLVSNKTELLAVLKRNSKILLQALPLTIILFFLFPRIQGNFGFLPGDDTGAPRLENELTAGEFSQNAFSNELAFRVEFNGTVPSNKDLYWRSKVFDAESNFTWKKGNNAPQKNIHHDVIDTDTSRLIQYNIIHQKTRDTTLPVLEKLQSSSIGTLLNDGTLLSSKRATNAFEYTAISSLPSLEKSDSPINLNDYLQTSFPPGEKISALIKKWRQQLPDTQTFINPWCI